MNRSIICVIARTDLYDYVHINRRSNVHVIAAQIQIPPYIKGEIYPVCVWRERGLKPSPSHPRNTGIHFPLPLREKKNMKGEKQNERF